MSEIKLPITSGTFTIESKAFEYQEFLITGNTASPAAVHSVKVNYHGQSFEVSFNPYLQDLRKVIEEGIRSRGWV